MLYTFQILLLIFFLCRQSKKCRKFSPNMARIISGSTRGSMGCVRWFKPLSMTFPIPMPKLSSLSMFQTPFLNSSRTAIWIQGMILSRSNIIKQYNIFIFSRKLVGSSHCKMQWIPLHIVRYSVKNEPGVSFIGGKDCNVYSLIRPSLSVCTLM